jgi:hypothetical protein
VALAPGQAHICTSINQQLGHLQQQQQQQSQSVKQKVVALRR